MLLTSLPLKLVAVRPPPESPLQESATWKKILVPPNIQRCNSGDLTFDHIKIDLDTYKKDLQKKEKE